MGWMAMMGWVVGSHTYGTTTAATGPEPPPLEVPTGNRAARRARERVERRRRKRERRVYGIGLAGDPDG
jgi:hypothetical protein